MVLQCGYRRVSCIPVTRRVCGYLVADAFNADVGRMRRVKHLEWADNLHSVMMMPDAA